MGIISVGRESPANVLCVSVQKRDKKWERKMFNSKQAWRRFVKSATTNKICGCVSCVATSAAVAISKDMQLIISNNLDIPILWSFHRSGSGTTTETTMSIGWFEPPGFSRAIIQRELQLLYNSKCKLVKSPNQQSKRCLWMQIAHLKAWIVWRWLLGCARLTQMGKKVSTRNRRRSVLPCPTFQ